MICKSIAIATPAGAMDAYVAHPDHAAPLVVLMMDIWGLRETLFGLARRLADAGYYCVVPDLFHREGDGRTPVLDPARPGLAFDALPEAERARMLAQVARIDRAAIRDDVAALFDFCRGEPVCDGAAGVIGFCMGGRFAFFAAQAYPDRFRVTASLHGVALVTPAEDSVHRRLGVLTGEVYCGYGENDRHSPPEVIRAMDESLAAVEGLAHQVVVHAGAGHGYAMADRDTYCPPCAETDFTAIGAMLARQLRA